MRHLKMTLLASVASLFIGICSAHAFSFDFGDDDDYYHYPGGWGGPIYRPVTPYLYPPQLNYFDRSKLVRQRQDRMDRHYDAMTELGELLYGKYGFDRAEAIQLARKIELTSGAALTKNFHPGAIRQSDSRTTPAYWGNEKTFRAYAKALQAAAADLAVELQKQPTAEEGAVFLPKSSMSYGDQEETTPVSPAIWDKYNTLSNACEICHTNFRGHRWGW